MSQAGTDPEPTPDENEVVSPTFVNRNPRNLEQMALAVKDRGWKTTWPHREFYHRSRSHPRTYLASLFVNRLRGIQTYTMDRFLTSEY